MASSTSSWSLRAPARSPCVYNVWAKLFIDVRVFGCSLPSSQP